MLNDRTMLSDALVIARHLAVLNRRSALMKQTPTGRRFGGPRQR